MIRSVLLIALAAIAGLLYWKREDAVRFAAERAPFMAPYLPGGGGHGVAAGPSRPAPAAVPVVVATVQRRPVPVTIDAVGTVQALASVALKSRIDGQISTVAVQEGALVKEGALLFKFDDRAIKAQLAQADALVEKDKAQIEQARRDLARAEELYAKRIGSEVARDTAGTTLRVQQAQLAADTASRDNLAAQLSYTEIRAPISGRIGSIALKAGATVKAVDTQAIATVNQVDPIFVSFAVPQFLFTELRKAMSAGKVSITARVGEASVPGIVAFVENTVDLATGTVLAKAEMANGNEILWPGAFVGVQATLGIDANAIAVPSAAVQIGQQGAFVFVVGANRQAKLISVTVARTVGGESVISQGLSGGEDVVIDGQLRLVDGAQVQIQAARNRDGLATGDPGPAGQRRG